MRFTTRGFLPNDDVTIVEITWRDGIFTSSNPQASADCIAIMAEVVRGDRTVLFRPESVWTGPEALKSVEAAHAIVNIVLERVLSWEGDSEEGRIPEGAIQ